MDFDIRAFTPGREYSGSTRGSFFRLTLEALIWQHSWSYSVSWLR